MTSDTTRSACYPNPLTPGKTSATGWGTAEARCPDRTIKAFRTLAGPPAALIVALGAEDIGLIPVADGLARVRFECGEDHALEVVDPATQGGTKPGDSAGVRSRARHLLRLIEGIGGYRP